MKTIALALTLSLLPALAMAGSSTLNEVGGTYTLSAQADPCEVRANGRHAPGCDFQSIQTEHERKESRSGRLD